MNTSMSLYGREIELMGWFWNDGAEMSAVNSGNTDTKKPAPRF